MPDTLPVYMFCDDPAKANRVVAAMHEGAARADEIAGLIAVSLGWTVRDCGVHTSDGAFIADRWSDVVAGLEASGAIVVPEPGVQSICWKAVIRFETTVYQHAGISDDRERLA